MLYSQMTFPAAKVVYYLYRIANCDVNGLYQLEGPKTVITLVCFLLGSRQVNTDGDVWAPPGAFL